MLPSTLSAFPSAQGFAQQLWEAELDVGFMSLGSPFHFDLSGFHWECKEPMQSILLQA